MDETVKGNLCFMYLAAFSGTLSIIASGMHYGWPSPSLPFIENQKNSTLSISNNEGSWIAVMPLVSAPLGSLIAAVVVDIIGRKTALILSSVPYFVAWIMIAFSNSVLLLCAARFIAGIADGWSFTAVPMYIGEIAHPKVRGLLGSGITLGLIFGIFLINILGFYLNILTTALASSVLPIVSFLIMIWMPESPYYSVMHNNISEAKKQLQILRGLENVDDELDRISKAVKAQMEDAGKFLDLFFIKSNRKAVVIIAILRGTQQLSGITAITFYTEEIFEEVGSNISLEIATILFFSVQLASTLICTGIVDKLGRRPLLILSLLGTFAALFCEGTYFYIKNQTLLDTSSLSYFPVASLIAFVIFFSCGMQSIPLLMAGELFATNVKAFALCLADIYFAITATIASKFFQVARDNFRIFVPFYVFSASSLIGLILIIFFVPETKGKTLEEIQHNLGGKTGKENSEQLE